jgi:hypothetical protein
MTVKTAVNGNVVIEANGAGRDVIIRAAQTTTGNEDIDLTADRILYNGSPLNVSDSTLKKGIASISNAYEIIEQLSPSTFIWKSSEMPGAGVIAQELQAVIPEAVQVNDRTDKLIVDYSFVNAYTTAAVKDLIVDTRDQQSQIDTLRALIMDLRIEIEDLKTEINEIKK